MARALIGMPGREIRDGSALARVRQLCLQFPDTEERQSHGEATWFAGRKKAFVMAADRHHDDRVAVWVAAPGGVQTTIVDEDPARYFRPPYVGTRGWVGVYLDVHDIEWDRVEDLVEDAWRCVAPRRLVAAFDEQGVAQGP